MRTFKWRLAIVLIILALGAWFLYPTIKYYTLSPAEKELMPRAELVKLQKKSLNLGLDLQGGMHLVLQVDASRIPEKERQGVVDRTVEVIKNRINNLGVSEPIVQKLGHNRILVQLPGVLDRDRAREIIGKTAQLEFRIVADEAVLKNTIDRIDRYLAGLDSVATDTTDTLMINRPFSSLLMQYGADYVVPEEYVDSVRKILSRPDIQKLIPKGYKFFFGNRIDAGNMVYRPLYLLRDRVELTGAYITNAYATVSQDPMNPNAPVVVLEFNPKGAAIFARVTSENVGKRLAIILDNYVYSAPVIREAILGGRATITGIQSMIEARDLANILKAGALPAPVKILEERTVGATLGKDSIEKGTRAILFGYLFVLIFMMLYYRVAGVVASVIQIINLFLIIATLAALNATLTLPGMAGLILTVGMAVDANVLIFERIREELRLGKSFAAALEAGYSKAMSAILDANITTLIVALVLLGFGTGPVRGFAVVLSIGIITSLFTAVFVSKVIFDYLVYVAGMKKVPV